MKTKYNIIGDIHGRDSWKKLVREDCINIFVGDYFSPYTQDLWQDFNRCRNNFMDIIEYKQKHSETILLIGNHDLDHWYIHERYSRFDSIHYQEIYDLFEENKDYVQLAYAINNDILVTHAGLSAIWYERYNMISLNERWDVWYVNLGSFQYDGATTVEEAFELYKKSYNKSYSHFREDTLKIKEPSENYLYFWIDGIYSYNTNKSIFIKRQYLCKEMAEFINNLFINGIEINGKRYYYSPFNFYNNAGPNDYYGDDERHSPVWIRPNALKEVNIFYGSDKWQIVGHTQFINPYIDEKNKIVFCDCLGNNSESIIYDSKNKNFEINKIQ